MVSVEVPEPVILFGFTEDVMSEVDVVAANVTMLEKPLRPVTVIVRVLEDPAEKPAVVELAVTA